MCVQNAGVASDVSISGISGLSMEALLDEKGVDEAVAAYMRQLIKERLTTKMLEIVDELQSTYSHDARGGANVFPVRAGEACDCDGKLSITMHSLPMSLALRSCISFA